MVFKCFHSCRSNQHGDLFGTDREISLGGSNKTTQKHVLGGQDKLKLVIRFDVEMINLPTVATLSQGVGLVCPSSEKNVTAVSYIINIFLATGKLSLKV